MAEQYESGPVYFHGVSMPNYRRSTNSLVYHHQVNDRIFTIQIISIQTTAISNCYHVYCEDIKHCNWYILKKGRYIKILIN